MARHGASGSTPTACRRYSVSCAGCGFSEEWTSHTDTDPYSGVVVDASPPSKRPWRSVERMAFVMGGSSMVCSAACAMDVAQQDVRALWPDERQTWMLTRLPGTTVAKATDVLCPEHGAMCADGRPCETRAHTVYSWGTGDG
jgi:hypothetical protein